MPATPTVRARREIEMGEWAMGKVSNQILAFVGNEDGMETVEWAVMAAIIVAGLVMIISALGTNVVNKFSYLKAQTN
jgi:Flp pilus assembly pilin Flp